MLSFQTSPFARGFYLACCAAIISCINLSLTAHAQQPSLPPLPPAKTASEPSAMERSQRQSDNVYRFIKQFADTPRKPDAAVVRPKEVAAPSPAPAPVRRPETPSTVAAPTNNPVATPEAAAATAAPVPAPVSTAAAEPVAPAAAAAPSAPVVEEEEELQLVTQVQPEFPRGMQSTAESGKVTVAFTVQPNGTVTDASVVTASHRRFGKPARDAVAQWRFAPIKAPRAVQVEIAFSLQ